MHSLVIGQTESGKTTLARYFAGYFAEHGRRVLILDPIGEWPRHRRITWTRDAAYFTFRAQSSGGCLLIVDEAGEYVGLYQNEMHWIATRARHYGHSSIVVAQRPAMVAPNVRNQCARLYLFAVARKDAELCAADWNCEPLAGAPALARGQFLAAGRFGAVRLYEAGPGGRAPRLLDTVPDQGVRIGAET